MADFNEDIFFAPITELNNRLRSGEFTVRELTRTFCDRLEMLGPRFNALVNSTRRRAMNKAGQVDTEIGRERFRGPLQGIPYGAKDLLAATGTPTTWGAPPFAEQEFDYDATAVEKLDGAGAILTGKLAMLELCGAGGFASPAASISGPGRNPWDPARWSGGSSGGSASAVAAGLVTFALASETSGSIIVPAAHCGVTGLRPTYGYVSRYGAMPLAWTMDKIGPICRSDEDCGLVLQGISGGDSKDSSSAGKRFYYAPQFVRRFSDVTIGYSPSDFEQAAPPEQQVFQQALNTLFDIGFRVQEVELPDFPYYEVAQTIYTAEAAASFEYLIESDRVEQLIDQYQIAGLKAGLEIPAKDYFRAMRIRSLIQREMRRLFIDVSILVTPSCVDVAPLSDASFVSGESSGEGHEPLSLGLSCLNPAGNLAGLPALSIPCGFVRGLPLGLNLVGRPFYENTLIAAGREYQSRTDWHLRRPPA